ncbi:hypothetical protein FNW02_09130 [Komarekiella sp. 'clone 1']|uniref:Uncharacterized protein n=1 Tax=Komarekiella delphini-convector SJRDD-AB1 TaxID=2593771 RepID=A0AA40VQ67_9NOST|nr:hypothetical protein [Komarekiella delphini-convector]MBD6615987.1 hypothetical protein [Komarekiella delphini-convector SJRDD-AB1]
MPRRHYSPAYLRYLKARLWNLGRPGFWGTAIFLSVIGLVTWEYLSNPEVLTRKQTKQLASQNPADSSLSAEDRAIAADIDNLPVLFNDFEQATLSIRANTSKENTDAKKSKSLLEDAINKQKSASDVKSNPSLGTVSSPPLQNMTNPFVVQTENLLRARTSDSNNQFLGVKSLTAASEQTKAVQSSSSVGIGLTNQTNIDPNPVFISPLQAALNQSTQSTNQKLSSFNGTVSAQTNALGQVSNQTTTLIPPTNSLPSQNSLPNTGLSSGTGYTSTNTNLPQNPYSNLNGSQVLPNVAPATPLSTPPTNIAPYSGQIPSQSVVTPINPVGAGNYSLQQPTQQPKSIYGNSIQQPTQPSQSIYGNSIQQPQSNFSNRDQILRQYIGAGGQK